MEKGISEVVASPKSFRREFILNRNSEKKKIIKKRIFRVVL